MGSLWGMYRHIIGRYSVAVWLFVVTKSCFNEHPFTFECSHLAVISASCIIIIILYAFPYVSFNICGYNIFFGYYPYYIFNIFVYPSVYYNYHLYIFTLQLAPLSRASAPATTKKCRESQHQRWSFRSGTARSSRGSPPTTCPLSYGGQSSAKPLVAVRLGVQRSRVRSRARGYRHGQPLEAAPSTVRGASGSLSKGERSVYV